MEKIYHKKIKYNNTDYYFYDRYTYLRTDKSRFFDSIYFKELNDEVEIIEEDKKIPTLKNLNLTKIDINKKGQVYGVTTKEMIADIQTLQNWINKVIDYINKENK